MSDIVLTKKGASNRTVRGTTVREHLLLAPFRDGFARLFDHSISEVCHGNT